VLVASGALYLTWEQTYQAAPGQRLTLTLPDGSTVDLNSGASLTYAPRTFGWFSRTTSLEGEAFFEVVPRESEFIARTHNAEVRVLGTSFNVRAWPEEGAGATVVALHSGRVRLTSLGAEKAVILRPGQMSRVDPLNAVPTQPKATDLSQATAWRTGRFVFVDEPLSAILDEMERRFDVSIQADAEEILDDRLSLAYDSPAGAESILADIASSYSRYRYRRISGGYELYVPR
jgi:ferric-dicitrate binding protein FerR (iron transport regulator)